MKTPFSIFFRALLIVAAFAVHNLLAFEVLQPAGNVFFAEEYATMVVKVPDPLISDVRIVNGDDIYDIPLMEGKDVYCKTVLLNAGENNITFFAYDTNGIKAKDSVNIYYTLPVDKKHKYPPIEYKQNFFHSDKNEQLCAQCHNMTPDENPEEALEEVEDSHCYACHKKLTKRENGHAPAVNFLCTTCHVGETGMLNLRDDEKSKFAFADPIGNTCFECHEEKEYLMANKRFTHDPAESGRCNRCHNPHSSKNQFYLKRSTWDLCTGCHTDKVAGAHVTSSTFRKSNLHPTHNKPDPSRPGRDLSCASCHNPHGSNKRYFLPDNRGNKMICTMCHKK